MTVSTGRKYEPKKRFPCPKCKVKHFALAKAIGCCAEWLCENCMAMNKFYLTRCIGCGNDRGVRRIRRKEQRIKEFGSAFLR